jgi:hypothetical protein
VLLSQWTVHHWLITTRSGPTAIDYRCKNERFPVSWSCVTIANPDTLSSSETGVNLGIRSWKKHSSEWAWWQEAIGEIYFTKKWRAETLQPGLEFDNCKPRLKSGIFKCICLLNSSFFWGDDRGFLKEGVNAYLRAPNSPATRYFFFSVFTSIVYGWHSSQYDDSIWLVLVLSTRTR